MFYFWRTQNALSRVKLTISYSLLLIIEDICENLFKIFRLIIKQLGFYSKLTNQKLESEIIPSGNIEYDEISSSSSSNVVKPVIFVSACVSKTNPGGWRYNGGIKELNYLVKLLRKHGYEAYMVTYDGKYEPWLIEHQPHISIEEFRSKLRSSPNVRCVTSYAVARAFTNECKQLYFWDMELALTEHSHFCILASLYERKIIKVAAISRTLQAWHMAYFRQPCTVIPNLIDETTWFPVKEKCRSFKVGYMYEGIHTDKYISLLKDIAVQNNFSLDFQLIKGSEAEILDQMRTCEVFLGLNIGKDPLWGEGCPRTNLEALSAGCVVIAFDIIGNKEIIQNNYNGFLVPRYRPDLMAEALINLYKEPSKFKFIQENSYKLLKACHTFDARWLAVKHFLDLDTHLETPLEKLGKQSVEIYSQQIPKWCYQNYLKE